MAQITDREAFTNVLISRVIENVPVRELIRVYSEAVRGSLSPLSDDELIQQVADAGFGEILTAFEIPVPAKREEAEVG